MGLATVKASFLLVGEVDHLADITSRLCVIPTKIRTKDQFKLAEFACYEWSFGTGPVLSKCLDDSTQIILKQFNDKIEAILTICKTYQVAPHIIVVVHAEIGDGPELTLTKEFVQFSASIQAEIGFDMYYYTEEEVKRMRKMGSWPLQ